MKCITCGEPRQPHPFMPWDNALPCAYRDCEASPKGTHCRVIKPPEDALAFFKAEVESDQTLRMREATFVRKSVRFGSFGRWQYFWVLE